MCRKILFILSIITVLINAQRGHIDAIPVQMRRVQVENFLGILKSLKKARLLP